MDNKILRISSLIITLLFLLVFSSPSTVFAEDVSVSLNIADGTASVIHITKTSEGVTSTTLNDNVFLTTEQVEQGVMFSITDSTGTKTQAIEVNTDCHLLLDDFNKSSKLRFAIRNGANATLTIRGENVLEYGSYLMSIGLGSTLTIKGDGDLELKPTNNSSSIILNEGSTLNMEGTGTVSFGTAEGYWDISQPAASESTVKNILNVTGGTLNLSGKGIEPDYITSSYKSCTITGAGAEEQGINGVYDADGYRPLATTPIIAVANGETSEIPYNGSRTLTIHSKIIS